MAIKYGKTRITFTTENEFEEFLLYMCKCENRNMSNLIDTVLKYHLKNEYNKWLETITKE